MTKHVETPNISSANAQRTDLSDHGGVLVELIVRLSVLVIILWLWLSAALLPHHGLLVVLSPVQTGALIHADTSYYLTVKTNMMWQQ